VNPSTTISSISANDDKKLCSLLIKISISKNDEIRFTKIFFKTLLQDKRPDECKISERRWQVKEPSQSMNKT